MASITDRELVDLIRTIFFERVPFNRTLHLEFVDLDEERVRVRFPMRPEFVGNFTHGTLHGGVTSAVLDTVGGLAAFVAVLHRAHTHSAKIESERFERLGTIDLRVDYLLPGRGDEFVAAAYILRQGNRVVVTRMELHNQAGDLLAVGTGAYNVS